MKKILICGEFWSDDDAKAGQSFSGTPGKLLKSMLSIAGVPLSDCYFTDLIHARPNGAADIASFCGNKAAGISDVPPVAQGKYILKQYAGEITRLKREIREVAPNLIIALGNGPLSILMESRIAIGANRGNLFLSPQTRPDGTPIKLLATYHPANVGREWNLRPIAIADLKKAARYGETPAFSRPRREIWTEPTLADIVDFENRYLRFDWSASCGVDIETRSGTITEIGFAPRPDVAIVIPFWSRAEADGNYWRTAEDEKNAWYFVRYWLQNLCRPIFQNGLYDINYLWRTMGIRTVHGGDDTMLLAHAQQPELKKGLGFLGSIYTDEPSWKMMRQQNETLKQEDD